MKLRGQNSSQNTGMIETQFSENDQRFLVQDELKVFSPRNSTWKGIMEVLERALDLCRRSFKPRLQMLTCEVAPAVLIAEGPNVHA